MVAFMLLGVFAGFVGSGGWLAFWAVLAAATGHRAGLWLVLPVMVAMGGHPAAGALILLVLAFTHASKRKAR